MVHVNMKAYNLAQFAEDLINTYDEFLDVPEHLQTPADLAAFLRRRGFDTAHVAADDLAAVKALRDRLRAVWTSGDLSAAGDLLTTLTRGIPVTVAYSTDGDSLHPTLTPSPDAPLVNRIAVAAASGIQQAIAAHGLDRLRACIASPCADVFIDTSKNARRHFCSDRCATRYHVAQHRARQKG